MKKQQWSRTKFHKVITLFAAVLILSSLLAPHSFAAKVPDFLSISSYPIGAHGAFLAMVFSEAISKETGIKTRPLPAPGDVGRFLAIKHGNAEVGVFSAASVYVASHGLMEFEKSKQGPQKIRNVFGGDTLPHGLIVKADSGIKTWADLKGKRVAMAPGLFSLTVPAFLAYGGLTLDDVTLIRASGYVSAIKMVMSGAADACHGTPMTPLIKEMEAAPYGLRFMPIDPKNKQAVARMLKVAPFLSNIELIKFGARGVGGKDGIYLPAYPYVVATYASMDPSIIYTIIKALDEGRDLYKNAKLPSTALFTMQRTFSLKLPITVPFHDGAIKYAKEKGLWTEKHEKWQANALAEEAKRMKGK
ncbi:MAG: TAXI family TRAP transporter solute-binding subunit [Desulfarculaceae bacterium]|nr:TAXI family TRAP transporter solute-binding subunit [Desulfarculaceae bacterium]